MVGNTQDLGKRLSELRRVAGLSQAELAKRAELALSTLTKIERGAIKSPSIFTMASLAKALGITLDNLFSSEQPLQKMASVGPIRFLYFDIHGVIATNWEHSFTALAERFNLPTHAVELAFWRYNDLVGRGHMSVDDFEKALAANLRVDAEILPFTEVYFDVITGDKGVHRLMHELEQHYSVGLFTNIFPGFYEKLMQMEVLPAINYAAIVESCEVGAVKPEHAIFDFALSKANTNPEHILLIDDTRANLDAAEHLGWQTFWFDPQHPAQSVDKLRNKLL